MPTSAKIPAPFGSWPSPVTAELIAGATIRLGQVALQGDTVFWTEGRPQEGGRNALVAIDAEGREREPAPAPFNVRSRVHEYGGGAFVPLPDGGVAFSHDDDRQLYRVDTDGGAHVLTTEPSQRYADPCVDTMRERLIVVREDHRAGGVDAPAALVGVPLDGSGRVEVLFAGRDFVASPTLEPDGSRLAWLAWDHPDMPWDAAELWLADVTLEGALVDARRVAGGGGESVFQPQWSPSGELHFVSDRTGWWNLYRLAADGSATPLHPDAADYGLPQWAFGMSTYGFDDRGRIVCASTREGLWRLARLDPALGRHEPIETPFVAIDQLRIVDGHAVFIGARRDAASALVRWNLATGTHEVLRASSRETLAADSLSSAEPIRFPVGDGDDQAHAFFYRPANATHAGPPGERPPLLVVSHGGPTAASDAAFKWSIQYWTSRGFAVVDVNYGGSTGYGRAYRARLDGRWGVVDVDDCVAAARWLVERGEVDPDRLAIRGGSAGGYTTLCALTFRDVFKAGASHYGIGDLETLATDTHKFESRYLDRLIGPWPEAKALYRERSPVHHVDRLASPMILLQGAEDKAVPPSQAEAMYQAVAAKGLPVAYLLFEGEQHGFRRAETIQRALEAELYFYGKIFGFVPADAIEPVEIRNLLR